MSKRTPAGRHVIVGVYGGGLTGIDTHAEHVAAAAATVAEQVTLIATDAGAADAVRARLIGVRVVDLGLAPPAAWEARLIRLWPRHAAARMARALRTTALDDRADIAHLNHPAIAAATRHLANRVVVAGWFYPHSRRGRVVETWRHTGARTPASAAMALKGLSHYANDARGYRDCDCVVTPTEQLAGQLRSRGIRAFRLAPPARALHAITASPVVGTRPAGAMRLAVCAGNLGHPRKNVAAAVAAAGLLTLSCDEVTLELVGGNAAALRASVERLPPQAHVIARGTLAPEAVHATVANADALLLPSLFEEWGYVAVEAALQGTPVVAFPVYPFGEMLAPPLGRCSDDMSPAGLAAAVEATLRDGADRASVALAADERFGVAVTAERLCRIWSELA